MRASARYWSEHESAPYYVPVGVLILFVAYVVVVPGFGARPSSANT
jgi:hypothetical protein